jgi:hypothetical protein
MNRIKLALITGGALFAAPAFAEEPADPTVEAGAGAEVNAGGAGAGMEATVSSGGHTMSWPKEILDRPLTVLKGKIGAELGVIIKHTAGVAGADGTTSEGLGLGAAYGISDKLEVGGSYGFTLNELEIKGPLALYGNFSLMNNGKLAVGAGAGLLLDFGALDSMNESTTNVAIDAGLAVRYKLAGKFAVFTGNPWAPGLLGNHLHLGLSGDEAKTFSFPVGFAFQATHELFAYVTTNLATISLSDPGMDGERVRLISDITPLSVGAWYAATTNIDVGATFTFKDLQNAGDDWAITVGARYFTL